MLLFKRILNYKKGAPQPEEKRKEPRFAVGSTFPCKTVVTLMGRDETGKMVEDKRSARAWAGRLVNLSQSGASINLHPTALAHPSEPCTFKLSLNDYVLDFSGTVAHFRAFPQYASFGFSFSFPNPETQKAYLQLLEPVSIGAGLSPVDPATVKQDTLGLTKEQYAGGANALLTVWRHAENKSIYSFDFRLNAFGVRWSEGMTEVEAYGLSKLNLAGDKTASPFVHLTTSELEDVRWLFCLAVPNLSKTVPLDVRKFLATLVA